MQICICWRKGLLANETDRSEKANCPDNFVNDKQKEMHDHCQTSSGADPTQSCVHLISVFDFGKIIIAIRVCSIGSYNNLKKPKPLSGELAVTYI